MDRWAIYIDIQGFSVLWDKEDQVLLSLGELMRAIFRIGSRCYPDEPDRLFAHQFGDGFLIVSTFHEKSLERCAVVAIALLRHIAATGRFAKATIVEGEMSDIKNCYPEEILDCLESPLTVSMKMGLMTINPVMGTALIRGASLEKASPRGPLLTTSSRNIGRLPQGLPTASVPDEEIVCLDWIHYESDLLLWLQKVGDLKSPTASGIEAELRGYCAQYAPPKEWVANLRRYLNVAVV